MRTVDRSGTEPLHAQLKNALLSAARSAGLQAGDRLPSEPEIEAAYRVSRTTIRQAMNALVAEGVVHRIQGKGTFLTDVHESEPQLTAVGKLTSFTSNLLAQGHVPSVRTLVSRRAPSPLPGRVGRPDDDFGGVCRYLVRLLLADGRAIGLQESWLPVHVLGGNDALLSTDALAGGSLYRALVRPPFELVLHHGVETISVDGADAACVEHLDVSAGDPVLLGQRTAFLADGSVAEYSLMRFYKDRYSYRVQMGGWPVGDD